MKNGAFFSILDPVVLIGAFAVLILLVLIGLKKSRRSRRLGALAVLYERAEAAGPGAEELWTLLREACAALAPQYPEDAGVAAYWGRSLLELGQMEADAETAGKLLREACDRCRSALGKRQAAVELRVLWAWALLNLAKREPDAEKKQALIREAAETGTAGLDKSPRNGQVLASLGPLLLELAWAVTDAASKKDFLDKGAQCLEGAEILLPNDWAVWANWGATLRERAGLEADPAVKARLLKEAETRCETGVRLAPDRCSAWIHWGLVLVDLARISPEREERARLLREARVRHEEAVARKPDLAAAWMHLAVAAYRQAEAAPDNAAGRKFLREGLALCRETVRKFPEEKELWYCWGLMLQDLALLLPPARRRDALHEAVDKIRRAVALGMATAANWSSVLIALADMAENAEERRALLLEGLDQCETATAAYPDNGIGWNNRGVILHRLAWMEPEAGKRDEFLRAAGESLGKILGCVADHSLWRYKANLGMVLAERSTLPALSGEKERLAERAEILWDEAEALNPGASALCRAAQAARSKAGPEAVAVHLERAKAFRQLSTLEAVRWDPSFAEYKAAPWFTAFWDDPAAGEEPEEIAMDRTAS